MHTACLERPVVLQDLFDGSAIEGTVLTQMTDVDGLTPHRMISAASG